MMQFIPVCLFTIICGYSLVISAPINQNFQEAQQKKATAIASHLLKELANEQLESQSSSKELKNAGLNTEKQSDDNEEDIEYIPTIDGLYPFQDNTEDDELSSEIIDIDDILSNYQQELLNYLEEQQRFDEDFIPLIHAPIDDDSIMQVENHSQ